jgi:hypothetical protein
MYDEAPSIKVWGYTGLAVFSLLFLFLSYCYMGFGPYSRELKKSKPALQTALYENNSKDTSSLSVVVVGSSLLERALVDPREIEKAISEQTKRPAEFLRISVYYMSMDLAHDMDLFESLVKYPPDYLFLENIGINLDDPFGEGLPMQLDAALLNLRNIVRSNLGMPVHENYYNRWYTFDIMPGPTNPFYTFEFDSTTYKSLETKRMVVRKVSENERANEAYAALKDRTKIVFLGMPIAHGLLPDFLDEPAAAAFKDVMKEYQRDYNINYWQFTDVMPDSCFSDGFHLNVIGAKKYQDWFVSKLASLE